MQSVTDPHINEISTNNYIHHIPLIYSIDEHYYNGSYCDKMYKLTGFVQGETREEMINQCYDSLTMCTKDIENIPFNINDIRNSVVFDEIYCETEEETETAYTMEEEGKGFLEIMTAITRLKMPEDNEANGGDGNTADAIQEDTDAITSETKHLVIEAKYSLIILIGAILTMSLLSILLSTWLAKTIINTPSSFSAILGRYFGFDRNETEQHLTWWTPSHKRLPEITSRNSVSNKSNSTTISTPVELPYSDYPKFHTIVLPLLFIGAIVLAAIAYYARIKCTDRGFAWGAVPKIPLGRVNPAAAAAAIATVVKSKEAEPGVDYTIVQGTKEEPIVFALADTLQPLNEERELGGIVDEGTQYEMEDIPKVIIHVSSTPNLQANTQTVPSSSSRSNEQQHTIELFQRQPLPTLSPST